jgi:hypothetical protein
MLWFLATQTHHMSSRAGSFLRNKAERKMAHVNKQKMIRPSSHTIYYRVGLQVQRLYVHHYDDKCNITGSIIGSIIV